MPDKDEPNDLMVAVMKLLQTFEPGGEMAPIEERDKLLVKTLRFGSNWWVRFGRDPDDPYRFTRQAAYYNSTGVSCGRKIRRHWVVPGLIRFNGLGDFNPHLPNRLLGHTFFCSGPTIACGGNRLLFARKAARSEVPECYLVVMGSDVHGRMDLASSYWKAPSAAVIAASQLRDAQEVMLLMKPGDWVQTNCGFWRLTSTRGEGSEVVLELVGGEALGLVQAV
jgi:hypothetical protein